MTKVLKVAFDYIIAHPEKVTEVLSYLAKYFGWFNAAPDHPTFSAMPRDIAIEELRCEAESIGLDSAPFVEHAKGKA